MVGGSSLYFMVVFFFFFFFWTLFITGVSNENRGSGSEPLKETGKEKLKTCPGSAECRVTERESGEGLINL